MVKPVFFDVVEHNLKYILHVLGDDGYLYVAEVDYPNLEDGDEQFNFGKLDIVKIELEGSLVKFGCMKAVVRINEEDKLLHEIYVAVHTLNPQTNKPQAKLYKFYRQYQEEINFWKWSYVSTEIPNTTYCMEQGGNSIILGGKDGIVSIKYSDYGTIAKPFIIDKIGSVLSLTDSYVFTFAGTEHGLLVSLDGFNSLGFKTYTTANTNQNLLDGGVGKITAIIDDNIKDGTWAYLFGENGISRVFFKFDLNNDYKISQIWGKPFKKEDLPDHEYYDYSALINGKDLADGFCDREDSIQPIKLFIMSSAIKDPLSSNKGVGGLIGYETTFDINAYPINKYILEKNMYFNSSPFDAKTNPKLQLTINSARAFALSDQMELSFKYILQNETKWTKIELPN